jgi:hypothetical protein
VPSSRSARWATVNEHKPTAPEDDDRPDIFAILFVEIYLSFEVLAELETLEAQRITKREGWQMPARFAVSNGTPLRVVFIRNGNEVETRLCADGDAAVRSVILLAAAVEILKDGDAFLIKSA